MIRTEHGARSGMATTARARSKFGAIVDSHRLKKRGRRNGDVRSRLGQRVDSCRATRGLSERGEGNGQMIDFWRRRDNFGRHRNLVMWGVGEEDDRQWNGIDRASERGRMGVGIDEAG